MSNPASTPSSRLRKAAIGALCTLIAGLAGIGVDYVRRKTEKQEKVVVHHQAQMSSVWKAMRRIRESCNDTKLTAANNARDIEWLIRLRDAAPTPAPIVGAVRPARLPVEALPALPAPRTPSRAELDEARELIQQIAE
jgi:hypothetical protein